MIAKSIIVRPRRRLATIASLAQRVSVGGVGRVQNPGVVDDGVMELLVQGGRREVEQVDAGEPHTPEGLILGRESKENMLDEVVHTYIGATAAPIVLME